MKSRKNTEKTIYELHKAYTNLKKINRNCVLIVFPYTKKKSGINRIGTKRNKLTLSRQVDLRNLIYLNQAQTVPDFYNYNRIKKLYSYMAIFYKFFK